jgi:hypothetical protein
VSTPVGVKVAERRRAYPGLDQLALRTTIVLGCLTTVVAAQAAGARPAEWVLWLMVGLALVTAHRPESTAGIGLLVLAAYVWSLAPETLSPLVLVVAAGMVLVHVAALVAAQGPARMRLDGVQVRRWAARGLVLWVAAAIVWGLSVAMADLPPRRLAYALGLTLLIVVAVVTTATLSNRPDRPAR